MPYDKGEFVKKFLIDVVEISSSENWIILVLLSGRLLKLSYVDSNSKFCSIKFDFTKKMPWR